MSDPGIRAKVAFLSGPAAYPDAPGRVEVVETHMSWVFLTERHAYKLKKPVRYDSLDFRSLALRRIDCEEEVRLNRRLARDVYLGTLALALGADGSLALGGAGEAVDWLVHMRRLPAEHMLDRRIRAGLVDAACVGPVAAHLARFYAAARPVELAPELYRKRLVEGTCGDRQELSRPELGLAADRVAALADAQLAFLECHPELFDRRVREGRIVEGHGDLRPEHICLAPQPAIIDCLEFARELRLLDPADELAFLALECEREGKPIVGRWFFDAYTEATGDAPPAPVVRFHRVYRALRRAKIAIWHVTDPELRDPLRWHARAEEYLALAAAS